MGGGTQISGIEYVLPQTVVSNKQLKELNPDWDIDHLFERTGVASRRVAKPDEYASDLGVQAVERLLATTGTRREDVDALLVCTITPDHVVPHNAAILHGRLGLGTHTAAFDFTLGCSGFVYGIAMAKAFIEGLGYKKVVLVTCDTLSRYSHPNDRATIGVFGDGAAATLFESSRSESSGILDVALGTDGRSAHKVSIRASGMSAREKSSTRPPSKDAMGNVHCDDNLVIDTAAALRFAMRDVPQYVQAFLDKNRLRVCDVNRVLLHQASRTILDILCRRLGVAPEQTFSNLINIGNTSASSLPILIRDAESQGILRRGDLTLLVGMGSGFSWGCCLMRW